MIDQALMEWVCSDHDTFWCRSGVPMRSILSFPLAEKLKTRNRKLNK